MMKSLQTLSKKDVDGRDGSGHDNWRSYFS